MNILKKGYKRNYLSNSLFLFCFIIQLSGASVFDKLQIILEFIFITFLIFSLFTIKLKQFDIFLIAILIFVHTISFFLNPLMDFLLNFKIYLIAVLSLIYFSKNPPAFSLVKLFFIINILGSFIYFFFKLNIFSLFTHFLSNDHIKEHGYLGILFNYHMSAYFLSLFLLGVSTRYKMYLLDYFAMFTFFVPTSFFSYFAQNVINKLFNKYDKNKFVIVQLFFIISLLLVIYLLSDIILNILFILSIKPGTASVLILQIFDPDLWTNSLNIFPSSITSFTNAYSINYKKSDISSEVALSIHLIQAGLLLTFFYIFYLFKLSIRTITFFSLSLFHYSFLTSPFIICVLFCIKVKYLDTDE